MTMASPETCSCFTAPFYWERRAVRLLVSLRIDLDVADQRAALRAVHGARGVEAEFLGFATQAEILRAGLGARAGALRHGLLAAELCEADDVFHSFHVAICLIPLVPVRSGPSGAGKYGLHVDAEL